MGTPRLIPATTIHINLFLTQTTMRYAHLAPGGGGLIRVLEEKNGNLMATESDAAGITNDNR